MTVLFPFLLLGSVIVKNKYNPASSREEAKQILDQIAGQMINGPWEFTIDQIEK